MRCPPSPPLLAGSTDTPHITPTAQILTGLCSASGAEPGLSDLPLGVASPPGGHAEPNGSAEHLMPDDARLQQNDCSYNTPVWWW